MKQASSRLAVSVAMALTVLAVLLATSTTNQIPTRRTATVTNGVTVLSATVSAPASGTITAGRYTRAEIEAFGGVVWLGNSPGGERPRGVELTAFGTGADNSFFTRKLWAVKATTLNQSSPADEYEVFLLATVTWTLSTKTGNTGLAITNSASYRLADTISFSASSTLTAWETAYGFTAVSDSPADNATSSRFILPYLNGVAAVIDEVATNADTATGGAVLAELMK